MTAPAPARVGQIPADRRLPGPDVVRAIALIGVVVMNYHGYLIHRGATRGDSAVERFFDPWTGPLSTRFAATFVLVAGVGVTLLTASTRADPAALAATRWRLARRGMLLYIAGVLLDTIWRGTIIPYYGAMFALAAVIITWRNRWILLLGLTAAISGAAIAWWRADRHAAGHDTSWFEEGTDSPRLMLFDLTINGTHPLLPWLAFFCAGIVIGRLLSTAWWRPAAIGTGLMLFGLATMISDLVLESSDDPVTRVVASTNPFDRGILYTASALGTSLIAMAAISWIADRYATSGPTRVLQIAGQMSLTLYIGHVLVFNLLVDWLGVVTPAGLGTALTFALVYWTIGLASAWMWSQRYRRGPLEVVYRRLTA